MKTLLRPEIVSDLVKHPEKLDVQQLLKASHQVFIIQTLVALLGFVKALYSDHIGLEHIANVIVPFWGISHTNDDNPENFRTIRLCAIYWIGGLVFGLLHAFFRLELLGLLVALLKTAVGALQWLALARLWRMLQDKEICKAQFYLNIAVKNKDEVIKTKLEGKRFGKLLGKLASKVVTDDKFGKGLAKKLEESIPHKMAENGISAKATKQFQKGNLIVLMVEVQHVDVRGLVKQKGAEPRVQKIVDFVLTVISILPFRYRTEVENAVLSKMASGLMKQLPEQMANQMKDLGGLEVDVESCSKEDEAEFLFAAIHHMEEVAGEGNKTN